jgi:hypothetical protein
VARLGEFLGDLSLETRAAWTTPDFFGFLESRVTDFWVLLLADFFVKADIRNVRIGNRATLLRIVKCKRHLDGL